MARNEMSPRASGEAKQGTSDPLLCPTCRLEVEAEIWTLRAEVRRALLAVSRGGDTGLVLHHFDDALHGLARLADYQRQGVLGQPPDVDALRCRLVGERYSVVSWASAVRTSSPDTPPSRPEALAWGQNAFHAPVIDEVLWQLAALQPVSCGPGAVREFRLAPDPDTPRPGTAEPHDEPRTAVRLPVLGSPGTGGGPDVDLSRGGAGFELDQPLAAGPRVWATLRRCFRL